MHPTDPRTRALLDRLVNLRMQAQEALVQTHLALAATDQTLRSARALLALPSVTADQLDRTPPDTH
jgi:hypothetical protein